MSYNIALSKNGKHLVCRVVGPITTDIAYEFTKALDRASHDLNIKRFLTDVREAPNMSGTLKNFNFAYADMENLHLQKDARSAILAGPADKTHDFIETASQSAGYNVRVFHDEAAALAWLDEEAPHK